MSEPLLAVSDLHVRFRKPGTDVEAVRGVNLEIAPGSVHALVGESGSGKSVTARALLGLLAHPHASVSAGSVKFESREIINGGQIDVGRLRGTRISMVFQEPGKHLNPSRTIGELLDELLRFHLKLGREDRKRRCRTLMEMVDLNPDQVLRSFPHELSGGMKQRALIAMAVSCNPSLLLADEPTTALDVTVQRQILDLIDRLRRELGMAVLFVSHDLGVVQQIAHEVSVIYAGRIIEHAAAEELFTHPLHPYTDLLLRAIPDPARRGKRLEAIPGRVPDAQSIPTGCAFHPRCPIAEAACAKWSPEQREYRPGHHAECRLVESVILPQERSATGGTS